MIRFAGDEDGKPFFGFGLSNANIALLQQGHPIRVDLADMGGTGSVIIFWGPNEQEMYNRLKEIGKITSETQINPTGPQRPVQPGEFPQAN